MKTSTGSRRLLSASLALPLVSLLALFSSCEKEVKQTSALPANDVSRQAASITNIAAAGIDTSALAAWYSFDSGSLKDLSSYHNRIIFNNAEPTTDRNGVANNAYHFNGTNNYMEVKNSPSLNPESAITIFAIAKYDDFYAGKCHGNRIINKGFDNSTGFYCIDASDNFYVNNMNCTQDVDKAHEIFEIGFHGAGAADTTKFIQTGHWYHIVYTYGNGASKLYIDGQLVETVVQRPFPGINNEDLFFGTTMKPPVEYPYWFAGSIDQIAIFNKALPAAQIAKLSNY